MANESDERVIATVTSAITSQEKLGNRVRYMLDQLTAHLNMPYGMVLEGRVSTDRYGNYNLYVFLRIGLNIFSGRSGVGNEGIRIEQAKGGKWISLNKPDFNPEWEARDLKAAVENFRKQEAEKA